MSAREVTSPSVESGSIRSAPSKRRVGHDERLAHAGWLIRLLRRPEAGAASGLIATIIVFALLPGAGAHYSLQGAMTFLTLSAKLGIIAVAAALLIIAGEFDLSVGSMFGFAGIIIGLTVHYLHFPLWGGIGAAFLVAVIAGYFNGIITVRTRLPSFIITFASLYFLRGLSIGLPRLVTGRAQNSIHPRQCAGPLDRQDLQRPHCHRLLSLDGQPGLDRHAQRWRAVRSRHSDVDGVVDRHHRRGKPCPHRDAIRQLDLRVGGDGDVARNVSVPVSRVKVILFICAACAATSFASIQVMDAGSADTVRGLLKEFAAIIAAVIGGVLLTGGYGHGRRRHVRSTHLRPRPDGHLLHRGRHRLVQGVPQDRHFDRGSDEQLHQGHGSGRGKMPMTARVMELRNVTKRFGSVIALRDFNVCGQAGEIHCLLGDNGAGKSTLIKILSGVHRATTGEILLDGKPVLFDSPRDAQDKGIATVFQDVGMIPLMSITRDFLLGREPLRGRGIFARFDKENANAIARKAMADVGTDVSDPTQAVRTLSGGKRQSVAIARAIHFGAKVLILVEPTSALGVHRVAMVLKFIIEARLRGLAVIFISHNIHHAYPVGDVFPLLNRGQNRGTHRKSEISRDEVMEIMSGGADLKALEAEIDELLAASATSASHTGGPPRSRKDKPAKPPGTEKTRCPDSERAVGDITEWLWLVHPDERDYSLVGRDGGSRGREAVLRRREWYHTDIPRKRMKELMRRRTARPCATPSSGSLCSRLRRRRLCLLGHLVVRPFFFCYGVLYGSASDSRWHECGHGTAFRTDWLNNAVYQIACFMIMREPTLWRWSHARHHTDTIIVGRDPEIAAMRPPAYGAS